MRPVVVQGAVLSEDGFHRYLLWRTFNLVGPRMAVCMFNPSKADAVENDPTMRRVLSFAEAARSVDGRQLEGVEVVNLFSLRSSKPELVIAAGAKAVGVLADRYLRQLIDQTGKGRGLFVLACGVPPNLLARDRLQFVCQLLQEYRVLPYALATTIAGWPQHPLYLPATCRPMPWTWPAREARNG